MISIPWLQFLFLIISLINKFHFPHNVFWGPAPYLHNVSTIFKTYFFPCHLSFFPLPLLFPFLFSPLFTHFPFLSLASSLFLFFQFASFPQFGLPFPKSAAPVLPHFLLPCSHFWSSDQNLKNQFPKRIQWNLVQSRRHTNRFTSLIFLKLYSQKISNRLLNGYSSFWHIICR